MVDKIIVLREGGRSKDPNDERNFRIKYADVLNPAQYEAVTHREGPLLVVAGAGSGKTRTLIYRVARLIESGVPPGAILLLTFTRRASQEMLHRAEQLVGDRSRSVSGGTFHSFANTVLRQWGAPLGLKPNFTILDRADMEDVINLLRSRMGLGSRERRFPKKGTLAEAISMARNKRRVLDEEIQLDFPHLIEHVEEIVQLAQKYEAYKRERGLLDYDDLLDKLVELLQQYGEVRKRLSDAYRYIMIDEYQDTNEVQAEIVRLLAANHRNVMAVGDDAQSIYSFRGANFRNILDFPKIFPNARIIKLEENYRSIQGILDVANEVISRAAESYTKVLFTKRRGEIRPMLVRAADEHMQSRFVAQRILELREEGRRTERDRGALPVELPFLRSRAGAATARHPVHQARRLQVHRDGAREGCPRASARGGESNRCGFMAARADAREGRRQSHRRTAHRDADQRTRAREGADRIECGDDCARPGSRRLSASRRAAGVDARVKGSGRPSRLRRRFPTTCR